MSGTSTTNQSSNQNTSIGSPTVQAAGTSLINNLSSSYPSWNPYSGSTEGSFGSTFGTAENNATTAAGSTTGDTGAANNTLTSLLNQVSSPSANSSAISSYINPYVSATLQPTLQNLGIQNQQQNQQVDANATLQGDYGGTGAGVEKALNNNYYQQNVTNATGQAYDNAYNSATQTNQNNLSDMLGAASGQTSLANTGNSLDSLLGSLGSTQQAANQTGIQNSINLNTQNQTEPLTQGSSLAQILAMLPQNESTAGTQTTSQPNNVGFALLGSLLSGI